MVDKDWGGTGLEDILNKPVKSKHCGESWELSGLQGRISVVSNGFLAGNNLQELADIYMGEMVGDHIYEKFGIEFPLLVKFIGTGDHMPIQVHPDDALAHDRHNAYGNTKMWYVMEAEQNAGIISGFKQTVTKDVFLDHCKKDTLPAILNYEKAEAGDVFYTPAGRLYSAGPGILLAEVQQTTDVSYMIHDWQRLDGKGKIRELHLDLAEDAIVYNDPGKYRGQFDLVLNSRTNVADCPWFTADIIYLDQSVKKDFNYIDSFVIYLCLEGKCILRSRDAEDLTIIRGETVLISASLKNLDLIPDGPAKILEVYIK